MPQQTSLDRAWLAEQFEQLTDDLPPEREIRRLSRAFERMRREFLAADARLLETVNAQIAAAIEAERSTPDALLELRDSLRLEASGAPFEQVFDSRRQVLAAFRPVEDAGE